MTRRGGAVLDLLVVVQQANLARRGDPVAVVVSALEPSSAAVGLAAKCANLRRFPVPELALRHAIVAPLQTARLRVPPRLRQDVVRHLEVLERGRSEGVRC